MELIVKLAAAALCGALFAAFLRPLSPVFGVLTALACGTLLLLAALAPVGEIFRALSAFLTAAGVSGSIYLPVIRAVGIAVLVHMTAQVCRDAGEHALGSKLELAGTIAALAVCIPLMRQVFALLESMLL
ncbi:MAG TPA: stage III sporulation AC/AD family protein [Candidatus Butyricicoccus stercorigallinarum]|nr:stage III sporulation AC/AD family protein [Candidatus Butyricicoccus stercorigallinarum]